MEYIIYSDESSSKGKKYGDFYGGCIIKSTVLNKTVHILEDQKSKLNLKGEIKWTKVTKNYLKKYKTMINLFFKLISNGYVKVRIMFRDINDNPSHPISNNDNKYFKLYYQFIKHAFGLIDMPKEDFPIYLRIYVDQLPDRRDKCKNFKKFLLNMPNTRDFNQSTFKIREDDIAEVCSHKHILLQCTDIVLGSMYFQLNELNKQKSPGNRTIAKIELCNYIDEQIRKILPNFNINNSTGSYGYKNPHWDCPYQHWKFRPK